MKTPLGQTPEFQQTWQALMRQLETVLSRAHQKVPTPTETAESVHIAQHHLQNIANQLNSKTPEGN